MSERTGYDGSALGSVWSSCRTCLLAGNGGENARSPVCNAVRGTATTTHPARTLSPPTGA